MKLSRFSMLAATAALATTFTVSAAQAQNWQFALEEIQGSVQDAFGQKFAERVQELSNGEAIVGLYPYGTIGTSSDLTELVQGGAIQMTHASPGHFGSVVPEVQVFSIPYLLPQSQEATKEVLSNSPVIYEDLQKHINERGLQLLTMYPEGQMVWTANKEIRSPEDFEGFQMRTMVSPMLVEAYTAFGAEPTPMPYGEVYSGLQLGTIDGQVNPIFAIEEMNFYEVQDYMIFAGQQQFTTTVVANKGWYDGLDERQKDILDTAISDATDFIFEEQQRFNEERLEIIKENSDIEIIELSADERAVFEERAQAARDKFIELTGDSGKAILEGLDKEFREAEEAAN